MNERACAEINFTRDEFVNHKHVLVQCFPLIRPTDLYNEDWPYRRDGLVSEHYYYARPHLGPPKYWPYKRVGLLPVGLISRMLCTCNLLTFPHVNFTCTHQRLDT